MQIGDFRLVKPKENTLIVRHNNLIEGRIPISTQEKRLFYWLISEIKQTDSEFVRYRVDIKDLAKFIKIDKNKNIYKEIWQTAQKLMTRSVELRDIEKNEMIQTYLVTGAKYEIGKGYIELEIGSYLKPYLLQLKNNFTTISLKYAMMLKTAYSMTMYDLLKQYQTIGRRKIEVDELKKILGINAEQYQNFNDFKKRILEPAKEDINLKTDIEFIYEEVKEGKKITSLIFTIQKNSGDFTEEKLIEISDDTYQKVRQRIINHGIKQPIADKLMEDFYDQDPHRILWCLEEVERQAITGKIKATGAWLTKAVQEDYRPQRNLFSEKLQENKKEQEKSKLTAVVIENIISKLEEQKTSLDRKYTNYKKEKMVEYILSLSDKKRQEIEEKIKPNLSFGLQAFVNTNDLNKKWSDTFVSIELQKIISEQNIILFNNEEVWCLENKLENTKELDKKILDFKSQTKSVKL